MIEKILAVYLIIINVFTLIITFYDKRAAKARKWRIPEKNFILFSLLGGSLGVFAGFNLFRHKTLHKKLYFSVFGIFFIETAILLVLVFWSKKWMIL